MPYEVADKYISLANEYRLTILEKESKDYSASLNVDDELAIFLYRDQDIEKKIKAIESRVQMDTELSSVKYHSWYVSALYFYTHGEYQKARSYIRRFYKEYYFGHDVKDLRQKVRTELLEIKMLWKEQNRSEQAKKILSAAIDEIKELYGSESFWLWALYEEYMHIDSTYQKELIN